MASEAVVLLHGLCRTPRAMVPMARALTAAGYTVLNWGYPSRTASIPVLSETVMAEIIADSRLASVDTIHFVTHSLGGILVRHFLAQHDMARLGRVVMLAPPNQGSEVVDRLRDWRLFRWLNGPSGQQLGTDAESIPQQLGPVTYEVGVIAGDRSINWINSMMIRGPDDGKVSVQRTHVAGQKDHITIHTTHPFIMRNRQAIRYTLNFLRTGHF